MYLTCTVLSKKFIMRFELKNVVIKWMIFKKKGTYLNTIKYYEYSKAKLSRANRFLDYVKHTCHPLVQYEKQIKNGEANLC